MVLLIVSGLALSIAYTQFNNERRQGAGEVTHLSLAALQIEPYIKSCIHQTTFDAVLALAFSAEKGYPFARAEAEQFIPRYIQEHLAECVDWNSFPQFTILAHDYTVNMTSTPLSFIIVVDWPLTIQQGEVSLGLEEFSTEFALPLNKVFDTIEDVQNSDRALDLEKIFDQELDIVLKGCSNGRLIYAIDDTEYQLDGSVISFFFDAPLQNLTNLFKLDHDLSYTVPVAPGKNILRREGLNKKFIFETTPRMTVKACYSQEPVPDAYTFTLIKDNIAIASATTPLAERVDIKTENKSITFSAENDDKHAALTLTLTFYVGNKIFDLVKKTERGEEKIYAEQKGAYLIARNQTQGTYTLKETACKGIGGTGTGDLFITFAALNYKEEEFSSHTRTIIEQMQTVDPFNASTVRYQFTYLNNTCNDFDCEQEVRESTAQCAKNDVIIGLVNNPSLGIDHTTVPSERGDISYASSYLTANKKYCIACAALYEVGAQFGLEDSSQGFMSLKNASLAIDIKSLSFTKEEKNKIEEDRRKYPRKNISQS